MSAPMNPPLPKLESPVSLTTLLAGFADGAVPAVDVRGLVIDSRAVTPGSLFCAVRGSRAHGLAHAGAAIAAGAAAIAYEPAEGVVPPAGIPSVAVPQLGARLGPIAARYYGEPSQALFVAGVTGTDGKTSTAHLIAQALDHLGLPCGYVGTIGYGRLGQLAEASHTTPDAIRVQHQLAELRALGARACAMEVSSHALDQQRVAGVRFGAAALTNVQRDHLDYHGTEAAYAAAKRRLFFDCEPAMRVLNRDDARGAAWAAQAIAQGLPVCVYGIGGTLPTHGAWLIAREVETHAGGLRLLIDTHLGQGLSLHSRLLGRFNACNLLAALGVLLQQGAALRDAIAALEHAQTVPGRMEAFHGPRAAATVVVDYAHTPQALAAALTAARPHARGRLICVFGCGGDRDRGKRPLMGAAVAQLADAAILTDDNPRSESPQAIVAEILDGVPQGLRDRVRVQHARAQAIREAIAMAGADDLVLIAGKGHEATQTYGSEVRPFSDRAEVAALLGLELRA